MNIKHIMVIELENESFSSTFGPGSPATYLNGTLLQQGELVPNWYATGHVSLDNYIAQVSGQGSNGATNNDCINLATLATPPVLGAFSNMTPGTDAADNVTFPGQVVGTGCVFPGPTASTHGAMTIGDQIDEMHGQLKFGAHGRVSYNNSAQILWREYAEDMGNNLTRDFGDPDMLGGSDCAHASIGGNDLSNGASATDQYATRHNPFVYFHSVIDDQTRCDRHVVPLGTVSVGSGANNTDQFFGHLYNDLQNETTTPKFMFVTPNLCNDGHDSTCTGVNAEGTHVGGLAGADLWLKHWMPMIFSSPAYQSGHMLVVLTFDEGAATDTAACNSALTADTGICNAPSGPNLSNFGFSPILALFGLQTTPTTPGVYPGGGQIGAVLFNAKYIQGGTVNTTGQYNHFSALRSYEDLLGIKKGGDDGLGHLGFAALPSLATFGTDIFNKTKGH